MSVRYLTHTEKHSSPRRHFDYYVAAVITELISVQKHRTAKGRMGVEA
jgi:hypothetical protein